MQGSKAVVAQLKGVLTYKLTGINQHFLHASMDKNCGLEEYKDKLYTKPIGDIKQPMLGYEFKELFSRSSRWHGNCRCYWYVTWRSLMLKSNLNIEYPVVKSSKKLIVICEIWQEYQRVIFVKLLADTKED